MLFHYSEEADIRIFEPRVKQNRPDFPAVVWALDEEHESTYYFPRDCPRIVCRRREAATDRHLELFFANTNAELVITVESGWYGRIANAVLYRYHFEEDGFELFDQTAGYYISPHTVVPCAVERVDNLMERLLHQGAEVRFTPNLHPLRDAILASDFQGFGIHRFGNALPRGR